jgi:hypothetical protein
VRSAFAERSSFNHWVNVSCSPAAGGELRVGFGEVPSKWPQKLFASIASLKRMENAVQFKPVGKSLGTDNGRMSVVVSAVVVVDIRTERHDSYKSNSGANNP